MAISASARAALLAAMASMLCAFAVRDHYDDLDSSAHLDRETADNTRQVALLQDATSAGKFTKPKVFVFDFDSTLPEIHVYATLKGARGPDIETGTHVWGNDAASLGWDVDIGGDRAYSELGQLRLARQLDNSFGGRGSFARKAFGGQQRVDEIRQFLQKLEGYDVDCFIASSGYAVVIIQMLGDLELLRYFQRVYGEVDEGKYETAYDKEQQKFPMNETEKEARGHQKRFGIIGHGKADTVKQIKEDFHVKLKDEAVYVDDDIFAGWAVSRMAVVPHVEQGLPFLNQNAPTYRHGIQDLEMKFLLGLCDGTTEPHKPPPPEDSASSFDDSPPPSLTDSHSDSEATLSAEERRTRIAKFSGGFPTRGGEHKTSGSHSDSEAETTRRKTADDLQKRFAAEGLFGPSGGGLFAGNSKGGKRKSTKPDQPQQPQL